MCDGSCIATKGPYFVNKITNSKKLSSLMCLTCGEFVVAHCPVRSDVKGKFGDTLAIICAGCGGVGTTVWREFVGKKQEYTEMFPTAKSTLIYPYSLYDMVYYLDHDGDEDGTTDDEWEDENW